MYVGICAQSHAPGKTDLRLEEFFKIALLLLLCISRANENRPEETLRAQTQFLRGLET